MFAASKALASDQLERNYREAINCWYGINRPINYTLGYLKFLKLVELGHVDSMLMLAECLLQGKGVDSDEDLALQWLEKAGIELNNVAAKARFAALLLDEFSRQSDLRQQPWVAAIYEQQQQQNSLQTALQPYLVIYDEQRALKLLATAAEGGAMEAETKLGSLLEKANEYADAFKWYTLASANGCPNALNRLGLLYLYGRGVIRQPETAFSKFVQASLAGDVDACNNAGKCYEEGVGVEKSSHDAMRYYHLGASRGSSLAMYNLGFHLVRKAVDMYDRIDWASAAPAGRKANGQRNQRNAQTVSSLLSSGILPHSRMMQEQSGSIATVTTDSQYFEVNLVAQLGIEWLRRAVDAGNTDAACQLGLIYERGIVGLPVDFTAAFAQYHWAALRGNARCCFFVGNMFYAGIGTPVDLPKAFLFYRYAATRSTNADAMNALGLMLEEGKGCPRDIHEASAWYFEATKTEDHEDAGVNLAMLLLHNEDTLFAVETLSGVTSGRLETLAYLADKFTAVQAVLQQEGVRLPAFSSRELMEPPVAHDTTDLQRSQQRHASLSTFDGENEENICNEGKGELGYSATEQHRQPLINADYSHRDGRVTEAQGGYSTVVADDQLSVQSENTTESSRNHLHANEDNSKNWLHDSVGGGMTVEPGRNLKLKKHWDGGQTM